MVTLRQSNWLHRSALIQTLDEDDCVARLSLASSKFFVVVGNGERGERVREMDLS